MVLMQPEAYRLIPLRRRDGSVRAYAIVDATDYDWLNQWRWCMSGVKGGEYVFRNEYVAGKLIGVRMHRLILGLARADTRDVDHINRNRLDNRRSNLRIVTRGQNMQNQTSHRGSTSRYRGVSWDRRRGAWAATARANGRQNWLGYYTDEHEAARVAEAFRLEHMTHNELDRR